MLKGMINRYARYAIGPRIQVEIMSVSCKSTFFSGSLFEDSGIICPFFTLKLKIISKFYAGSNEQV